jgi:hypothetical protein
MSARLLHEGARKNALVRLGASHPSLSDVFMQTRATFFKPELAGHGLLLDYADFSRIDHIRTNWPRFDPIAHCRRDASRPYFAGTTSE